MPHSEHHWMGSENYREEKITLENVLFIYLFMRKIWYVREVKLILETLLLSGLRMWVILKSGKWD